MDPDRRQHSRFNVRVPVEFFPEGSDSPIRGATSDLSLSGCYIETVFPFAPRLIWVSSRIHDACTGCAGVHLPGWLRIPRKIRVAPVITTAFLLV
jgi:PilZ domain-containing protein